MSAGLHEARSQSPGCQFQSPSGPPVRSAVESHDYAGICFDRNVHYRSTAEVSSAVCFPWQRILPPLPRFHIAARGGKVSLLEVPEGVRYGVVGARAAVLIAL